MKYCNIYFRIQIFIKLSKHVSIICTKDMEFSRNLFKASSNMQSTFINDATRRVLSIHRFKISTSIVCVQESVLMNCSSIHHTTMPCETLLSHVNRTVIKLTKYARKDWWNGRFSGVDWTETPVSFISYLCARYVITL